MNKLITAFIIILMSSSAQAQSHKSLKDIDRELKQTKSTATAMMLIESIAETIPQTAEDIATLGQLMDKYPTQGQKAFASIKDPKLAKAVMKECDRQVGKFKTDKDKDWKTQPETQRQEKFNALLNTHVMIATLGNLKNKEALPFLKQYITPEYDGTLSHSASQAIGMIAPNDPVIFKELWDKQDIKYINYNAYGKSVLKEVAEKTQDPNIPEAEKKKILDKGNIWGLGGRTAEEKALIKDVLLNHPNRDLRAEAGTAMVHAVINNPEESDKDFVIQWAKKEKSLAIWDAPSIMDKVWDKRFVPVLLDMLKNQADWMPRKDVAELLGRRQVKESLPYLEKCILKDKESTVRGSCRYSYYQITGKVFTVFASEDVASLEDYYKDPLVIKTFSRIKQDDPSTKFDFDLRRAFEEYIRNHSCPVKIEKPAAALDI